MKLVTTQNAMHIQYELNTTLVGPLVDVLV